MKILTLNTWNEEGPWRDRWETIFAEINSCSPDIIGFQEIFNGRWAQEIAERIKMGHWVFPKEPSGLMLLSRYPILESVSKSYLARSPQEDYARYLLFARLQIGDRRVAVINTHLSWRLDDGAVRSKQIQELVGFAHEHARGDDLIAVGDFNTTPDSTEIQGMRTAGWLDVFQSFRPSDAGLTWDNLNPYTATHHLPDRRLDFIFLRQPQRCIRNIQSVELAFTKPGPGGIYASDHYGILATFRENL